MILFDRVHRPDELRLLVNRNGMRWQASHDIHDFDPECSEIQAAQAWIRYNGQTTTIRPGLTSYSYKHRAEKWAGTYISNGDFIAAAMLMGVKTSWGRGSPNTLHAIRRPRS